MARHQAYDDARPADGFGVREVAELLGTTPARVRGWVRAGLVEPQRGARGALRFSFRDLAFLRRLNALEERRIAPRRVRRVLRRLRDAGRGDLGGLDLDATRRELVLREGETLWSAESGQGVFDFERRPEAGRVVCLDRMRQADAGDAPEDPQTAERWYQLGDAWAEGDPERARQAYERALALDPRHADAAIDLGCLLHEQGRLAAAERAYRQAVAVRPDATACFDLAVVLEDQGRDTEARRAYEQALAADARCAEALFNLARLCERAGDRAAALRHLKAYRQLAP